MEYWALTFLLSISKLVQTGSAENYRLLLFVNFASYPCHVHVLCVRSV
jgi:hypothetical protein